MFGISFGLRKYKLYRLQSKNHFSYGYCNIPHPKKAYKGGEDAYYASHTLLSVADGVGGWNSKGVDPAISTKILIKNIVRLFKNNTIKYLKNPKQLMYDAVNMATKQGSSTIVIVSIDKEKNVIYGANLGDSGYSIFRFDKEGQVKLLFETPVQQHRFNCPYQAGLRNGKPYFLKNCGPDDYCHVVQHGDLVVLATDGILDNLYMRDIIRIIQGYQQKELNKSRSVNKLAKQIA